MKTSIDDDIEAFIWGKDGRMIRIDVSEWSLSPNDLAETLSESTQCRVSVKFTQQITVDPAS